MEENKVLKRRPNDYINDSLFELESDGLGNFRFPICDDIPSGYYVSYIVDAKKLLQVLEKIQYLYIMKSNHITNVRQRRTASCRNITKRNIIKLYKVILMDQHIFVTLRMPCL